MLQIFCQIPVQNLLGTLVKRILAINCLTFSLPFSWKVLISLGNFQEAEQTIIAFKYGKKTMHHRERRDNLFLLET